MKRLHMNALVVALLVAATGFLIPGAAEAAAPPARQDSFPAIHESRYAGPVGSSLVRQSSDRFEGTLFRTYHHDEWVGFPPRLRRYYFYVSLAAPSDIGQERWDQLLSFSKCAINQVAEAAAVAVVTGGISLADAINRLGIIAANCGAVNPDDIARASIFTYVGR
ncbi:hypothetical protein GCM10009539_06510 [Cryptosporangium japonicum]|uniref:Uncharacterized protein n=2 Tax=Cryptosporangium japonicum TaxID=80872 RepID=A0ABN0TKJ6_9ACTN